MEQELKGNYIHAYRKYPNNPDYYSIMATVPGKRTYKITLFKVCKPRETKSGKTEFYDFYTFDPDDFEPVWKMIAPFEVCGMRYDDVVSMLKSNYCDFLTDSAGFIDGFPSVGHALRALLLLDKEMTKRFGIPQEKNTEAQAQETNTEAQDKPHRLAGHVRLEFE